MLTDGQTGATLAVTDIDRARTFYTETLGFPIAQESEGGILFTSGQGTAFFVYPSQFAGTNKATAMTINVEDFDGAIAELRGKGVELLEYDLPGFKTENGVVQTPDGPGAWFADPDGNIIAVVKM
jgi:catechol 2,3-dioxygenase-like lactoylglutathione lyase family enzyme